MVWYQENRAWNRKVKSQVIAGIKYDSNFEAGYALELEAKRRKKEIKGFEAHVKMPLTVNGYTVGNYYVDFKVYHNDGTIEYVETKGYATDMWRWKWRHFEAEYGDDPNVILRVIKQQNNFILRKLKKSL